ncbi:MAG: hypothetical protein HOV94_22000 [Saccharothrix sp.]|nr:hypothetical protein [Saccharothrix sp.]
MALIAAVAMAVAFAAGGGTWQLLLGPASATWSIFALHTARGLGDRATSVRARVAAAVAAALLIWLVATPLWPALLFPAAVGLVALGVARRRA